jgi:hypothetical protein
LNGVPYSTFRREVGLEQRRAIGAFFSSPPIADAVASNLARVLRRNSLVIDPTCGIGDLLLSYAMRLEVRSTLAETLEDWGHQLAGFDTRAELVQLCKARLCLLARARGQFIEEIDALHAFPLIQPRDMFARESLDILASADGVLFNPPFGKVKWPEKLDWSAGEINAAAIFLDKLTASIKPSAAISAVLPEVLRCGARYKHFRTMLAERGFAGTFQVRGKFDNWADVDVFTCLLVHSDNQCEIWRGDTVSVPTVEQCFEVRVGTVVPHRDPENGKAKLYICAKTTPAWNEGFRPTARRGFESRTFQPPFVAIRRTSSPSDRDRAVATLVVGTKPVLVENHLLVALPKDESLESCRDLLALLRAPGTNDWLNRLMRCRHLTTGIIKSLPWPERT